MKKMHLILIPLLLISAAALQAAGLQVSPNPAEVQVNTAVAFTIQGLEPGGSLNWEVVPATLGNIDQSGFFTASGKPGRGMVRAIAKNKEGRTVLGHAMIKVLGNKPGRLTVSVSPARAELKIGQTLRFTARIMLPDENIKTEWLVIPNDLGTIDAQGDFTANGAGKGRIVALAKGPGKYGLGQAQISVRPSGKVSDLSVVVSPKRIKLQPKTRIRLTVQVQDPEGETVRARLRYTLSPPELGTIDQDGNFTAGEKAGLGVIKVEAASGYAFGSDRAFVIISEKSNRYQIKIKPRQVVLEAKSSSKFEVEVWDENGSSVIVPALDWKVIPEGLGSISPQGLFTAGDRTLSGKIVVQLPAEFGRSRDAASVKIQSQGRNTIRINPPKTSLKPGQMLQFSAVITDSRGKPAGDQRIIWKLQPENLGIITPQGLFTAGAAARSGIVIAELPQEFGAGRAIAPITISSYQVKINAPPNQYNIHTGEQILFAASVRDANGNDLTASAAFEWDIKSSILGFGNIDQSTGLFRAGQPSKLPADGYIMVRVFINGLLAGTDGIKITIR
ncbi:MAG: Ig-like domain-containing protein [Candidatus Edwardsbacteria bacterium]|nr:Ig-like domain-containing protein [Candidatus Edwardsbacteria bacterium]MBU1577037.1 Ig-like domain-containing protein [Candidatus Edwardsbacteria bacterium]MBU2464545.1 Ig-like domain-containing protein [Candidatus Edwardsbacteria bacterium]MBU2593408.1 Ig-like domain-containing protein [Candidatus Edwardsbacteria bacterium]